MTLARAFGPLISLVLILAFTPAPASAALSAADEQTTSVSTPVATRGAEPAARRPRCKRADVVCIRRGADHQARKLARAYRHHRMGRSSVTHRPTKKFKKEFRQGARRAGIIPCHGRCPRAARSARYRWDGWKDYFGWFTDNLRCNVATGTVPGTSPDDLWAASCYDAWNGHNYQAPAYVGVTCGGAAISAWYRDPRLGPIATATAISGARAESGLDSALVCGFSIAAYHAFDR